MSLPAKQYQDKVVSKAASRKRKRPLHDPPISLKPWFVASSFGDWSSHPYYLPLVLTPDDEFPRVRKKVVWRELSVMRVVCACMTQVTKRKLGTALLSADQHFNTDNHISTSRKIEFSD